MSTPPLRSPAGRQMGALDRAAIEQTWHLIAPRIRATPVLHCSGADFGLGAFPLSLKLEHLQIGGSFKVRGAFANLLLNDVPPAGVVAASGGNHGAAVAWAASAMGRPAHIFVPTVASPAKLDRIRAYGGRLTVAGDRFADAFAASQEWASAHGALEVHAYDQRETILGQGTLGIDLSTQVPDADTVLIAVGGGGLIAGVAAWYQGRVRVIGVEPTLAPTLAMALEAGHPVDAPAGGVAADSLAPRRTGAAGLDTIKRYVDRVLLVEDAGILRAQRLLWETTRVLAEPGGAAAMAALVSGAYTPAPDERVAVIICGGNTSILPGTEQAQ